MTEIGQLAPDFTLPQDGGPDITLSELRPNLVVLYFYPRDDTSGCTKQAIGFTEERAAFRDAGATIIGVSRDTVQKHAKFREKHGLGIALLSDEDGQVCENYGVWTEKQMYGRTFWGIERSTFLIDGDGMLLREWRKVKLKGHIEEVIAAIHAARKG
ncbi:peroxiredoxin [Qingshengfaniella alkalisoli]|uniref:thioredoxin-dependent peroxiredoxin n=1 Tax=Qingshengfaniella alkalisoli TaxID=2599296 RepID=A0A5B8IVI9_9RHOB|nr:peroxiredoxin [Qingshengfaniella alkalisoli]QDY68881.1 peroxiredoxin [Qingshengfaniella alkalisoli]